MQQQPPQQQQHLVYLKQAQRSDAGGDLSFPDWRNGRTAIYKMPSAEGKRGASESESVLLDDSFELVVNVVDADGLNATGVYTISFSFPEPPPPPPPPPSAVPPKSSLKELAAGTTGSDDDDDGDDGGSDDGSDADGDDDLNNGANQKRKDPMFGIGAGKGMPRLCPDTGYADGHSVMSGACHPAVGVDAESPAGGCPFAQHLSERKPGSFRPGARRVSNALLAASKTPVYDPRGLNALHYHFGQFISHDLSLSTQLTLQDYSKLDGYE